MQLSKCIFLAEEIGYMAMPAIRDPGHAEHAQHIADVFGGVPSIQTLRKGVAEC